MTNSEYWIWFQLVFGIGTRRAELFQEYFDHPKEIYESAKSGGRAAGMLEPGELTASEPSMELAAQILRRTLAKGCEVVTPDHAAYPKQLRAIYSRPAALYVKGNLGCLGGTLAIAMVGARRHTEYGKEAAAFFAEGLAKEGAVVVSGLAPGIDTESHRAALAAGGKTVGVLGCGLDVDYPRESREIKTAVSQNGAVVTEYPLGSQPYPANFPMRNRIISGMSHGILVVEADLKSGSLITARLAREQGRDVFAVPGSIFARGEQGTHILIKDGARLADSAGDILALYTGILRRKSPVGESVLVEEKRRPIPDEDPANQIVPETKAKAPKAVPGKAKKQPKLQPEDAADPVSVAINAQPQKAAPKKAKMQAKPLPEGIGELAARVYAGFAADTMTVDDLAAKTGLTVGELLAALTELEIYGCVACHPGRRFGRI